MTDHREAIEAAVGAVDPTIFQNCRPGAAEEVMRAALVAFLEAVQASEGMRAAAAKTPGMAEVDRLIELQAARGYKLSWKDFGEEPPLTQAWRAMKKQLADEIREKG